MGGRPLVALNIVGFPTACEPLAVLEEILQGGAAKVGEAGAVLAGGHSVQDEEPKYGLVVFGEVKRGHEWRVDGVRGGDALLLTKALGTGIAATAIKAGLLGEADAASAAESMSLLNNPFLPGLDSGLLRAVHACTDVTGFGFAGHALDMLGGAERGMSLRLDAASLPVLPGVLGMASMGMIPAGSYANRGHCGARVQIAATGDRRAREIADIIFDPQTSGGLLLSVDPAAADELLAGLKARFPAAARVGEITEDQNAGRMIVVS